MLLGVVPPFLLKSIKGAARKANVMIAIIIIINKE
jgi:hypothetical protein